MPALAVALAVLPAAWCVLQVQSRHLAALAPGAPGLRRGQVLDEDDPWLRTGSQDDRRRDEAWNRFRDDDYFRNWNPNKPFDQALDPSKDPCLKVKCSPHKVCVTQDYQTALCLSRKHLLPRQKKGSVAHKHWVGPSSLVKCRTCPGAQSAMVCGSDGHTYMSKCKLEFHACSVGKSLSILCDGPCPCLPEPGPPKPRAEKNTCTDKELRSLASRLKDWFGALHQDANRVVRPTSSEAAPGRFDTSILPICKDSLGWMFNKLDMNYDLLLDASEINAVYLDRREPCIKPLFSSCDSFKDGKLSNNEWCYCFQKPAGLPCQNEMNRIQKLSKGKSLLGAFVPRCTEDGYYGATQCHGGSGQCWCVDKYGNELAGSRRRGGAPACAEAEPEPSSSGLGSGAAWPPEDLEEARRGPREDDEDGEDDDKEDEAGDAW